MSPRAFLFDLDGTLVDEFEAIHRRYVHTLTRLGLAAPSAAQVRAAVGGGLENGLSQFVPAERLDEALRVYRARWAETVLDGARLMPGALELLGDLGRRGASLAVITNKPGPASRALCAHLGISAFISVVVGAEDTPWLKPRPELSARVLALLGAPAAAAVLVGDSPYDIQAAHNGGMAAWCVPTGTHGEGALRAAGADRVFADLAAIGRHLPGLGGAHA